MAWRYRERDTLRRASYQKIGSTYMENRSDGEVVCKSDQMSDVPVGVKEGVWDEKHPGPPYLTGGPFFLRRTGYDLPVVGNGLYMSRRIDYAQGGCNGHNLGPNTDWRKFYQGGFTCAPSVFEFAGINLIPTVSGPDDRSSWLNADNLEPLGSRAYKKLSPKFEVSNLMQSLIEMKETVPMLKTSSKAFHQTWKVVAGQYAGGAKYALKKAAEKQGISTMQAVSKEGAGHFLNHQFGWRPFVQDVVNMCDLVINFEDHLTKAEGINNKWMKRRFREQKDQSETVHGVTSYDGTGCIPYFLPVEWLVSGASQQRYLTRRVTEIWYEGRVKVYRPEFDTEDTSGLPALKKVKQMLTLAGVNINPSTLWKVTPWSWLVDWFVNVGDFIQLLEDTNSTVFDYFYLMRRTREDSVYQASFAFQTGPQLSLEWTNFVEVKRRMVGGSPFSFTMPPSGLSGMQVAILAALGLSKKW